ncbi:MAG: DUF192 domain-containing protein [Deltaproteobacteria bacterium]
MARSKVWDNTALYLAKTALTGKVIASRVRVADTLRSRATGLLNRSSLDQDEGLLIVPCDSIHTLFMRFPIDILYLDKEMMVVHAVSKIPPFRLSFCLGRAQSVLELKAGTVPEEIVGQRLIFEKQH